MGNNNIKSEFETLFRGLNSIDEKIIRDNFEKKTIRLALDNKGAMVNDIVDKYLKKELTEDYLNQIKEEYKITSREIMREIAKRQIEKAMGI
jgi:hypothetical protein